MTLKNLTQTPLVEPFVNRGMPVEPRIWTVKIPNDPYGRHMEFADYHPGGDGKPVLAAHGRGQRGGVHWTHYAEARMERGERIIAPSFSTHGASSSERVDIFTQRPQHIVSVQDQVQQLDFALRYAGDLFAGGNQLDLVSQSFMGLYSAVSLQGHDSLPTPRAASHVGLGSLTEAYMDLTVPKGVPFLAGKKIPLSYWQVSMILAFQDRMMGMVPEDFAPNDARSELLGARAVQDNGGPVQSYSRERTNSVMLTDLANFLQTTDHPTRGTLLAFIEGRNMALSPEVEGRSAAPQLFIIGGKDYINKPELTARMADHIGADKVILDEGLHESMQLLDPEHNIGPRVNKAIDEFYAKIKRGAWAS